MKMGRRWGWADCSDFPDHSFNCFGEGGTTKIPCISFWALQCYFQESVRTTDKRQASLLSSDLFLYLQLYGLCPTETWFKGLGFKHLGFVYIL